MITVNPLQEFPINRTTTGLPYLIYGVAIWGLTASKISRVKIGDVLDKNGQILKRWILPEQIAFNKFTYE